MLLIDNLFSIDYILIVAPDDLIVLKSYTFAIKIYFYQKYDNYLNPNHLLNFVCTRILE